MVAGGTERRVGEIYGYDKPNARVIALSKVDGGFRAQYRLAGGAKDLSDLRAMYIIAGAEGEPSTLVWITRDAINQAILVAVPDRPPASPGASAAPSASPAKATPKPTKKP